mgnify:CR=1 FL=1
MTKALMAGEAPGIYQPGLARPLIDWTQLVKNRPAVLKHTELPPYLLLPEIRALLATVHHANNHLLFSTLWHTGARISEALAITARSFERDPSIAYVSLKSLKQRGRPRAGIIKVPARMVPLRDPQYLNEVERYLATHRPAPGERLFSITRQAADLRLRQAVRNYEKVTGSSLSIPVTSHTFRHSFAVNAVLHGVPLTVLQAWLGHKNLETTAIYTQVLAAETGHLMQWVEF